MWRLFHNGLIFIILNTLIQVYAGEPKKIKIFENPTEQSIILYKIIGQDGREYRDWGAIIIEPDLDHLIYTVAS